MNRSCSICVLLLLAIPLRADDSALKKTLSNVAQESAIKALKDQKFDFDESGFSGTFEAIDPDKNIKVEVKDFSLGSDTVKTKVQINGLFRVKGKYTKDGATTELEAELSLEITPTAEAHLVKRGEEFYVKPSVKDLDFKIEVKELKPDSLAGGKGLVTDILNAAYKKRKDAVLKAVNAALVEKKLDL